MKKHATKRNDVALRITHQVRPRGIEKCMTYGLECEGVALTLVVSPRTSAGDPGDWLVEARAKGHLSDMVTAAEWGETRVEALQSLGRSWDAERTSHGLHMFDWTAVQRVLQDVRAI